MLETIVIGTAIFGAFCLFILSYIGFRVLFHAFTFAAKVGIASAQVSLLARAHPDVRAKIIEDAVKEDEKEADKASPKKP